MPFFSPTEPLSNDAVNNALQRAFHSFSRVQTGELSTVYPALALADPDAFGITIASVGNNIHLAGAAQESFTIMSISKPFVFALVCDSVGVDAARDAIGVNATGRAFNDVRAIREMPNGRTNPMVNAGAIATTSRAHGAHVEAQWEWISAGLSAFAGHALQVDEELLVCALDCNHKNREIANMLESAGHLASSATQAVELYTRQCAVVVNTRDLAIMGATLAAGGINPVTGTRVVSARACRHTLAAMATAGMYERSGDWLWDVGLPGKSGISGGIVTIAPGKGSLATYSPPLDPAGNSVRGTLVAEQLALELGFDLFAVPSATQTASDTAERR